MKYLFFLFSVCLFSQAYKETNATQLNINSNINTSDFQVVIVSPSSLTSSITLTLPQNTGSVDQVLTSLGNGSLTWTTVSGGSASAAVNNGEIQFNNSGNFGASSNLFWDNSNNRLGVGTNTPAFSLDVNGGIQLGSNGSDGTLVLYSEQGPTDFQVSFTPSSAMSASTSYTWPPGDGTNGQVLLTDGNGNLQWSSISVVTGEFDCVGQGTGGGAGNTADGNFAFVGGGTNNEATGANAFIGGGEDNTAGGDNSSIVAGVNNTICSTADNSVIAGGVDQYVCATNSGIFVGNSNTISNGNQSSFIGAGNTNVVSSDYSGIVAGENNTIGSTADYSLIGAGQNNAVSGNGYAFIGGGGENEVSGQYSGVAGGLDNTVSGDYSMVAGGEDNDVSGDYSFAFGLNSDVSANYGVAIGRRAKSSNQGSFVFGDSNDSDVESSVNDSFVARFDGGYFFYTNAGATIGASLTGNSWSSLSDSTKKENFLKQDPKGILNKIMDMQISSWNYKEADDKSERYYGPMAQDFNRLFGKDIYGSIGTDTTISQMNLTSIGILGVQGIAKQLEEKQNRIEELEKINIENSKKVDILLKRLEALESKIAAKNEESKIDLGKK